MLGVGYLVRASLEDLLPPGLAPYPNPGTGIFLSTPYNLHSTPYTLSPQKLGSKSRFLSEQNKPARKVRNAIGKGTDFFCLDVDSDFGSDIGKVQLRGAPNVGVYMEIS